MNRPIRRLFGSVRICAWVVALVIALGMAMGLAGEASAQGTTTALGHEAQTEFWRAIRQGESGTVSIPDKKAAQLIQSEGDNWRAYRNGPLSNYSAQAIIGMIVLLGMFFILRGRVRIDHGWSGWTILRFNSIERFGHWLLAVSFIILALTGLNLLYGRYFLLPLIGPDAFALITSWGKYAHNYVAFAFMLSLVLIFVMWIAHNLPSRTDIVWVLKGGGILGRSHPPAKKFNFGQKIIFWLVILLGASISMSGLALLFPFQATLFADTFAILNAFGFNFPTELSPIEEMQYAQLWHTMVSAGLIALIIAHIYIGTLGMEGAFAAMGSGRVDLNWAKEHHSLWVEKLDDKGKLQPERDPDSPAAVSEPAE